MAALSYREYPPPADLARWIACFWQIGGAVGESSGFLHRVLPDGCADLLFDLQAARRRGGVQGEVVGPMSAGRLVELRAAVDQSHLVRDFQAFVGLSPTRWAATQAGNAGFLQDGQVTSI